MAPPELAQAWLTQLTNIELNLPLTELALIIKKGPIFNGALRILSVENCYPQLACTILIDLLTHHYPYHHTDSTD
jgi:hypothetical protein